MSTVAINPTQRRSFSLDDQQSFALFSGDHNPLHVDPILARRYLFGQPVVHGVHAVLWGLDCLLAEQSGLVAIQELRATFHRPNVLDESIEWALKASGSVNGKFELRSGGMVSAKVSASWTPLDPVNARDVSADFPRVAEPRVLAESEIEGAVGAFDLRLERKSASRLFKNLALHLAPTSFATLLATTRLVGNECPGLHSIFSELRLSADESLQNDFRYQVTEYDPRFRLAVMAFSAPGAVGTVRAFVRPAPREQQACSALKALVLADEFAGQRALVIGGSRGLGEVTAKVLAMGGADVQISYQRGKQDAERVIEDIAASGGRASAFCFDVCNAIEGERPPAAAPTHLYYYATPLISAGSKLFDEELFQKFCAVYVGGFARTLGLFYNPELRGVFWPSTIYVGEVPDGMREYAAAKAAGESVCDSLAAAFPGVSMAKPRLPRLATDQTAGLSGDPATDPVATVLQEVRAFCRRKNATL